MRGPDTPKNGRRRASQIDVPAMRASGQAGTPPDRPRRSSLANWSVSTRLVALFLMASLLGLVFGGLRIADTVQTASDYSRSVQLADIGKQSTALAQAMEDERDRTAGVIALTLLEQDAVADKAGSKVVAPLTAALNHEQAQLTSAQSATNAAAAGAQTLIEGIGAGYPASIHAKAATVLQQIAYLLAQKNGLRLTPKVLNQDVANGSADEVIQSYSGVLSILFGLEGEITTGSGDVQLGDDVRALTALSSAEDQASQQRAILYGALIASALNDAVTQGHPHQQRHRAGRARQLRRPQRVHHRPGPAVRRPAVVRRGRQPGAGRGRHQRPGEPRLAVRAADRDASERGRRPHHHLPAGQQDEPDGGRRHLPGQHAERLVRRHVVDRERDAGGQRPAGGRGRAAQPAAAAPGVRIRAAHCAW